MKEIKRLKPGQGNEIHITDAIKNLIYKNENFYGNIFKGKYLDCGTLNGYINSGIEISKEKNEFMYDRYRLCWISKWNLFC